MPTFKMFKGEVGMVRGADEAAIRDLLRRLGDKWSGMSGDRALGSGAADAEMSDREKRLAALERRGLGGGGGGRRRRRRHHRAGAAAGRAAAGIRRRGGREPCLHLGPGLAPPRRRAPVARRARLAAATRGTRRSPRRSPRRCKRRRRGRPAPSRRRAVRGATRASRRWASPTRRRALALDAAGGDVATTMGALVVDTSANSTSAR